MPDRIPKGASFRDDDLVSVVTPLPREARSTHPPRGSRAPLTSS